MAKKMNRLILLKRRLFQVGDVMSVGGNSKIFIAHIIYRLDFGGLENGLVNLINNMSGDRYEHAIICLTDYSDFAKRIKNDEVRLYALHKKPGKDLLVYLRLWRLLRKLRPTVVHSRNLAALDCQVVSWLAAVPCRVHSEHGWDMVDLHGQNRKYAILRKITQPFVHSFLALSRHQYDWMLRHIGIPAHKLFHIYNGVDTDRFAASGNSRAVLTEKWSSDANHFVLGTVGRMQRVKDQVTLTRAFIELLHNNPELKEVARLVMVGDGELRNECLALLEQAGFAEYAWLPGSRNDVPTIMQALDLFVLPSLNEGISNTILEAMACGLPVLATKVGGNPELVIDQETGCLVSSEDPHAMADAINKYVNNRSLARQHGAAGRSRVEKDFSLQAMVSGYDNLYDSALRETRITKRKTKKCVA